jgi:hypothetical protein
VAMSCQTSRITGIFHWLLQPLHESTRGVNLRRSLLRNAEIGGLTTWIHLAGDAVDLTGAKQPANQRTRSLTGSSASAHADQIDFIKRLFHSFQKVLS